MPYYDPNKWISSNDQLIPEIEDKLIEDKTAFTTQTKQTKSFKPPSAIEFNVVLNETKGTIRLSEWEDRIGRVYIELTSIDSIFRKGHFNQERYHHNPDGRDIKPPHHIHFPTRKYPLNGQSTYAYRISSSKDYLNNLISFCNDTNIDLNHASIPLMRR